MISSVFAEECAYALMAEVGATPKPGLVDRHDSGAHTDMDYDTFAASTTAIVPYLARMFEAGYAWESKDFNALLVSFLLDLTPSKLTKPRGLISFGRDIC